MTPLIFLDRRRRADAYPWLAWKVRLFVIGAALAVGGMMLQSGWVVTLAIAILFTGFLLRFLPHGRGEVDDDGAN